MQNVGEYEMRPIGSIRESEHNAREHSAAQVAEIAASMREFGFINPILVDEKGVCIAGHGRLAAARQLGLAEVPCIAVSHLSEVQKRGFMLADNKIALNSGWNEDLLREELVFLETRLPSFGVIGFSDEEIDRVFGDFVGNPIESVLDDNTSSHVFSPDTDEVVAGHGHESGDGLENGQAQKTGQEKPAGIRIPLLINLSRAELELWKVMKREVGEQDNTAAFKILLGIGEEQS